MSTTVITIDPALREVKHRTVSGIGDNAMLDFVKEFVGGELDHGIVAVYPSGHKLCIWVYEYGLVGGPKTAKEFFILNNVLYNGRAVIYTGDHRGETVPTSKALADHLARNQCPHLIWAPTAQDVERLIAEGKCTRPETTMNGKKVWSWSPAVNYDQWQATMEENTKTNLKDILRTRT